MSSLNMNWITKSSLRYKDHFNLIIKIYLAPNSGFIASAKVNPKPSKFENGYSDAGDGYWRRKTLVLKPVLTIQ